jgi:hypothetical protein
LKQRSHQHAVGADAVAPEINDRTMRANDVRSRKVIEMRSNAELK